MHVLFASSEAVPFSKTGGLADVSGALPRALARLGHEVSLVVPAYRSALSSSVPIESLKLDFIVPIGTKTVAGHLLKARLPNSTASAYLIQQDQYFDREFLYGENGKDYADNCERFVFFSRAVLEAIRLLDLRVDVLHANDWQTGLVPAYLDVEYRSLARYRDIANIFTVHNLAYQGIFWHWDMLLTGLDWKYFNYGQMEYYGKLNLLKTGLAFADALTTVSPRYALEIQSEPFGCGLDSLLRFRSDVLTGILNGVDTQHWNPSTDPCIAARYGVETVSSGKPVCKAALQREMGLKVDPNVPIVGVVGRLAHQKGYDLMLRLMMRWCETQNVQWAILGTGELNIEDQLRLIAERHPEKVAVRIAFSDDLAHRIEAGADMFLMPSRYEPCGLNQQYSLLYGTVPIVRETGGLADTVVDVSDATIRDGTANGFRFQGDTVEALEIALQRALQAYKDRTFWNRLIQNGMREDRSWENSARKYAALYEETIERRRGRP